MFELTKETRNELLNEMTVLLDEYGYDYEKYALLSIIDTWADNKRNLIELFMKHPDYNGKFQISFDRDFERKIDTDAISHFCAIGRDWADEILVPNQLGFFSRDDINEAFDHTNSICDIFESYSVMRSTDLIKGKNYAEWCEERSHWIKLRQRFYDKYGYSRETAYTRESYSLSEKAVYIFNEFYRYHKETVDDALEYYLNIYCPQLKAVAGQKTSRIMNKFCKLFGFDKQPAYNREFAKYADAINTLKIKRHTVISIHPIDYLTMSFGNSWASCHTIDKCNKRGMPDSYSGCYSSGTISYMLDGTSMVFYTVDKGYNGDKCELQPKINRNMFHFGHSKLIQGRVYPQDNDDANDTYKQIREIVHKVLADCLEIPNLWTNVKGSYECATNSESYGTHYKDYTRYENCNVSYLKSSERDTAPIEIGHKPICIYCGEKHYDEENIDCCRHDD